MIHPCAVLDHDLSVGNHVREVIPPVRRGKQMPVSLKSRKQASRESRGRTDESLPKHTAGERQLLPQPRGISPLGSSALVQTCWWEPSATLKVELPRGQDSTWSLSASSSLASSEMRAPPITTPSGGSAGLVIIKEKHLLRFSVKLSRTKIRIGSRTTYNHLAPPPLAASCLPPTSTLQLRIRLLFSIAIFIL